MTKNERLVELGQILEERDTIYDELTEAVFELIDNTVLTALLELFSVPDEQVTWLSVDVIEDLLVVSCFIEVSKAYPGSEFLRQLFTSVGINLDQNESDSENIIKVGVPLMSVFEDKDKIIQQMTQSTTQMTAQEEQSTISENQFDSSSLTEDQILQMTLLQALNTKNTH